MAQSDDSSDDSHDGYLAVITAAVEALASVTIVKNPNVPLDLTYLWSWADRLGLQGELHYVLQAAGPSA